MLEYVENTDNQYIETGCIPNGDIKPYTVPVYGCRWYDGEELIKDYTPCKNAEGVEGMFDTVTGEFLDRDGFVKMMNELYMPADEVSVRIVAKKMHEEDNNAEDRKH